MLLIILMAIGTAGFLVFAFLFLTAGKEITQGLFVVKQEIESEKILKLQIEIDRIVAAMRKTGDLSDKKSVTKARQLKRRQDEARKQLERYQAGKMGLFDMIPVAGYRLIQIRKWDATKPFVKELIEKCMQFKNRKEAVNYAFYLIAALLGYIVSGVSTGLLVSGLLMGLGLGNRGLVVGIIIIVGFSLFGYIPYDSVNQIIAKRSEEIEASFPQAVSKMALLTVAGIEVNTAWKLTSESGETTLYEEMARVLIDLANNVSPTDAYSKFIARCNNKYTTKLATAIIQNISKGNSEIVTLFKQLNDESWMEHKHSARRMGEKISSKLMIPTMLMFAGILIMIIVPVMSGFNF